MGSHFRGRPGAVKLKVCVHVHVCVYLVVLIAVSLPNSKQFTIASGLNILFCSLRPVDMSNVHYNCLKQHLQNTLLVHTIVEIA